MQHAFSFLQKETLMLPANIDQPLNSLGLIITARDIEKELLKELHFKAYQDTIKDIDHHLAQLDIDFEGKQIPISIVPTIIQHHELEQIACEGKNIRRALEKIIEVFCAEHKAGDHTAPLHHFFLPYKKWWDLIASEARCISHIQLMRFDAIHHEKNTWKFLETNTCCPGGVIHCGKIRNAWLMTKIGYRFRKKYAFQEYEIDSANGFLFHIFKKCKQAHPEQEVHVAICSYKECYKNELASLKKQHERLKLLSEFSNSKLIICDIQDIQCYNEKAYYAGVPLSLIYNKIDPLMVNPDDTKIQGWIHASKSEQVTFLNSLGAMYLTETKRSLALLHDKKMQKYLKLSGDECKAIENHIPQTWIIHNGESIQKTQSILELAKKKTHYVIKADALTRGAGVYVGNITSEAEWKKALIDFETGKSVLQEKVNLPLRQNYCMIDKDTLQTQQEYYGIDLFYFGDAFAGAVSRSHINQVFNIGNGGKESPLLAIIK